ncbi:MAG: hypothetical protein SNF93_02170 [Rikenellaceae bacterium]
MSQEFNPYEFPPPEPDYSQRIEQEVVHVERQEPDPEEQDEEPLTAEQAELALEEAEDARAEAEAAAKREAREANLFWQFISGNWLILEGIAGSYRYLLIVAATLFLSVVSIFYTFHLSEKYARKVSHVQLLQERSLEYQRARFNSTSHTAILKELRQRGIPLYDLQESKTIIEK